MKHLSLREPLRFTLLMLLALLSFGGSGAAQINHDKPIQFLIIAQNSTVPVDSNFIAIDVELYNVSGREVRLSTAGLGSQILFVNRPCSLEDSVRTQSISLDPSPTTKRPESVRIPSGGAYRRLLQVRLDHGFFRAGIYSVRLSFAAGIEGPGQKTLGTQDLTSNEVFFEVIDTSSN